MDASLDFPVFDDIFPDLNRFIRELAESYNAGKINSWDELDCKVKSFFTPEMMDAVEAKVPGWEKMASFSDGVTLTHVMCVFLGLFIMPEFQALSFEQQQLAKWTVLYHDVEKVHINGKRDYTHAFRSAITAAKALRDIGFVAINQHGIFDSWYELILSAITDSITRPGEIISDNSKLPEIVRGIEEMYGTDTSAALIVKGVLLHMSIDVVKDWPQPAPLTDNEILKYVDWNLVPLLKVMHLADSEGWSLFYPEIRAIQRSETLEAFQRVERMIHP